MLKDALIMARGKAVEINPTAIALTRKTTSVNASTGGKTTTTSTVLITGRIAKGSGALEERINRVGGDSVDADWILLVDGVVQQTLLQVGDRFTHPLHGSQCEIIGTTLVGAEGVPATLKALVKEIR